NKCYLYFDKKKSAADTIVVNPQPSTYGGMFNVINSDTTNSIYSDQDDDGTSYYYRGNPSNNWVKFGGFYWRIIRFNGDGSIRMIYQGTAANATGEGTQIGASAFNSSKSNRYVGYFYTEEIANETDTASTIYGVVNSWYVSNIKGKDFEKYIDENAGFCNDRQPSTTSIGTENSYGYYVGNGSGGTATTRTFYGAYMRLTSNGSTPNASSRTITPTFRCADIKNDLFTYKNANQGNKKLDYPVGLITADEASYAGLVSEVNNTSNYLFTGKPYWTMSPGGFDYSVATVIVVNLSGQLYRYSTDNLSTGVRPVINLKADVTITGSGTSDDPYEVSS
ncbi:MAG: hypothetical protein K2J20_01770, partial [Bacilli bacterium]|nr:hypothetical protein [Bacilli bacterium]